jgi:hypothetical protein
MMKPGDPSQSQSSCSKLVSGIRLIWLWWPVFGFGQTLPHANVGRQSGPQHSPGGERYDQKPPDHPHGIKHIKLGRAAVDGGPEQGIVSAMAMFHQLTAFSLSVSPNRPDCYSDAG